MELPPNLVDQEAKLLTKNQKTKMKKKIKKKIIN